MANLNENATYLSQPKNKVLVEKVWKTRLDAIESATGKMGMEKKVATAIALENTREAIRYMESVNATQSADIGAYKRYALDIVGAVVPNLIAYDIASVQAINNRIAMVNYMKYNYGNAKGATPAGYTFADVRNLGQSDVNYTSEVVDGEEIATGSTSHTLDWVPAVPGTVKLVLDASTTYTDDGNGGFVDGTGAPVSGYSINYESGAITIATATSAGAVVNYSYANEHVPMKNIPSITLSIESLPIKAHARRLAALWGFEASYELQKEYGQSMEDLLSETASGEIAHEIDMEVMDKIKAAAVDATTLGIANFNRIPASGVYSNLQDHYDSFLIKVNEVANKIYQRTRRIRPNYILCGTGAATIITANRQFKPSGEAASAKGPYFAGTLSQYKVFVSPDFSEMEWCLGYKGDSLLDAGFIYAPYMPIMSTAMVQLEDMAGRKGWATMYGTRLVNDKMYLKGAIV